MAEKLRTNFKIGDILSPEDVNRTNATINANLDSIKVTEDAATSAAASASSAAQAASEANERLSDLQDAMQDLPDGQAVSAEVADHEVRMTDLEENTATKEEIAKYGEYNNDGEFYYALTDSTGAFLFGIRFDGSIEWAVGVPTNVRKMINDVINQYGLASIINKVDKVEGKGLSTNDYDDTAKDIVDSNEVCEQPEDIYELASQNGVLLLSANKDGEVNIPSLKQIKGINNEVASLASKINSDVNINSTQFTEVESAIKAIKTTYDKPFKVGSTTSYVVNISNQSDFDNIISSINEAISGGHKKIVVNFSTGKYYYSEKHIKLAASSSATAIGVDSDTCITLCGNGSTMIASGAEYSIDNENAECFGNFWRLPYSGTFQVGYGMIDENNDIVDNLNYNDFQSALSGVTSNGNNSFKIAIPTIGDDVNAENVGETQILFTSGWQGVLCSVEKIETSSGVQYVYFTSTDTIDNLNMDMGDYNEKPKFKIVNSNSDNGVYVNNGYIYIPYKYKKIYESHAATFLYANGVTAKQIVVSGFNFISSSSYIGSGTPLPTRIGTIWLEGSIFTDYLVVTSNNFVGLKAMGVYGITTSNIYIGCNLFDYCYKGCISCIHSTNNVVCVNNKIKRVGLGFNNSQAIINAGVGYITAYNEVEDFAYAAITTGSWYQSTTYRDSEGVIEGNIIHNTEAWANKGLQNILHDGGCIYVMSRNDTSVIRHNVIYNTFKEKSWVGIYVDGGGHGYKIYQNIVLSCPRSLYQTWWGDLIGGGVSNTDNVWMYNIVDGTIDVAGNALESTKSSYKGVNFILYRESKVPSSSSSMNTEEDCYIRELANIDSIVYVNEQSKNGIGAVLDACIMKYILRKD